MAYRIEKDSMGDVRVPVRAYWSAQTQRALENFPISNLKIPKSMIKLLSLIKRLAAEVNAELLLLDAQIADTIIQASSPDSLENDKKIIIKFLTSKLNNSKLM